MIVMIVLVRVYHSYVVMHVDMFVLAFASNASQELARAKACQGCCAK
jgi:hypothetical protein